MSREQENPLIAERRRKLDALRAQRGAYPNDFRKNAQADELHGAYGDRDPERLENEPVRVAVAGRMMAKRVMGKASFSWPGIRCRLAFTSNSRPGISATSSAPRVRCSRPAPASFR
jgi:hypothetical protein